LAETCKSFILLLKEALLHLMEFNPNFTYVQWSATAEDNVHHNKTKHNSAMLLKTVTEKGFFICFDGNIATQEEIFYVIMETY
jgi:hypothetical protein